MKHHSDEYVAPRNLTTWVAYRNGNDHGDDHNNDVEHNVHIRGDNSQCSHGGGYNSGNDIHDDHNGSRRQGNNYSDGIS
ncbi:unnamed protein product, partial [Trichobilharzia regenti]